ncbi:metallophosphatase domain-containing protein [Roseibacillus persicicus]|uniref:metallophosphatase domain-containing protein n=1 Tax=Roseibacillus persicicus TaxID=454148 RepID=UPI00398B744A
MPQLVLISDTHRNHRQVAIPECDLLIHAGDFCSFEKEDRKVLADVDDWFGSLPAKEILCVGGNHDFLLDSGEFSFQIATLLQDQLVKRCGLSVYGSPWIPNLPNFAYHRPPEELAERWKAIPEGIDILVTHTAPHGILDFPSSHFVHLGCELLKAELQRIQPRLHVFGHIHGSHGQHEENGTHFVNASIVGGRNLEVRNTATRLEFPVK